MTRAATRYRLAATTAVIVLGLLPTASPAAVSEGQSYLDKSEILQKSGDLFAAIIQLKNAVKAEPDYTQARFQLGVLQLRVGDAVSAQRELENVRARGFDEKKVLPVLLQSYMVQRHFRDVIRNFEPDKFTGDVRAEVLAVQARASIALEDIGQARTLVADALATSPLLPSVLISAAILARVDQRLTDVHKYVDAGLSKSPENTDLLVLKADVLQEEKDFDGAAKLLDSVIARYPTLYVAYLARARVNLARNKPESAPQDVRTVLTAEPKNQMGLYLQALLLSRAQKFREGSQILLAMPELLNGYPPARYLLAASLFADNQLQSALSNAEFYLKQVPGDPVGSKLLAAIAMRLNEPARAVQVLEPLLQNSPEDQSIRLLLAKADLAAGRADAALKVLESGNKNDPQTAETKLALAQSQIGLGQVDAGILHIEDLVHAKPDSLEATQLLVLTYLQSGNFPKARDAAETLIKADPKNANAYNLKGMVEIAAKDFPAARLAFKSALEKDAQYAPAMLNLAWIDERDNNKKAAQDWYRKTLSASPRNSTAFSRLAGIALIDQDPDEAAKILAQAIVANPTDAEPRLRLIDLLLKAKKSDQALIIARNLSTALPEDPQSVDALGRVQLAAGAYLSGLNTFRHLVAIRPRDAEAKRRLVRALLVASAAPIVPGDRLPTKDLMLEEAKVTLDAALVLSPDNIGALGDRLVLEKQMNGEAAALKLADGLVAERPNSVTRLVMTGEFAAALGKNEIAVTRYRSAWEMAKSGGMLHRLYTAMAGAGKSAEGLKMLKAWAGEHPTDTEIRYLIATVAIDDGRYDDAIADIEAMEVTMPNSPVIANSLAWLYGQKKSPRAFEFGQKALTLAPNSPDILDTVGWLETQSRDLKKGVALLAKSYALAPNNPMIGYHYAVAATRDGNQPKALEVLKKTLENKAPFKERTEAETLLKELES